MVVFNEIQYQQGFYKENIFIGFCDDREVDKLKGSAAELDYYC